MAGYELFKINLQYSTLVRLNAQGHYAHNNEYHYGIRSLESVGSTLYLGTEGGISTYQALTNTFANINGTGLAISQVSDMTTTHNSSYDIIIHNSHRNGIWRQKCNRWDNFWWDNGGTLLLDEYDRLNYDNGQPDYVHNITSTTPVGGNAYTRSTDCLGAGGGISPDFNYFLNPNIFQNEWNFDAPLTFADNTNNIIYQGRSTIFQSNDFGVTWSPITINGQNGYPNITDWWQSCLKVIKVAPNNPNIMYISFQGWGYINGSGSTPYMQKIYRGQKVGNTWSWTDLSAGINALTFPAGDIFKYTSITDIAINPNNANECWVTLDGFWGTPTNAGANRVLHLKPKGSWEDFTNGLTAAPVNCIVYNEVSNVKELFTGTDLGVFYCNASATIPKWELFHNNNPQWIVTDLEINYNLMKLRAATWGNSVWETKIKCSVDAPVDYTISSNTTWVAPKPNCGNIVINAGATLTINSTSIEMAEDKKIEVKRGGRLILNSATIKGYCQTMWQGITMDGNYASNQSDADHAYIELQSSSIEDALIGVKSIDLNSGKPKGGGEILAYGSTFRNNQIAVKMLPYAYKNSINSPYDENLSAFTNCHFITDAPLKKTPLKPIAFLSLTSIYGLKILGCNFENTNKQCDGYTFEGIGIDSKESYIIIDEYCSAILTTGASCPPANVTPTVFSFLDYGIKAFSSFDKFSVKHSRFYNNLRGLYMDNINNFYVLSNTFNVANYYDPNVPAPNIPIEKKYYGAYLNYCPDNYHFEDNHFTAYDNVGFIGLYIYNSDKSLKLIYNNTFNLLQFGLVALGYNGPENTSALGYDGGLKIKCNDFTDCDYNIAVVNETSPMGPQGIGYFQGTPNATIPTQPAGNTFAISNLSQSGNTYLYNEANSINYTTHWESITKPIQGVSFGFITVANTNLHYTKATACPPMNIIGGGSLPITLGTLYASLITAQQQLNSAKLILQIWTDGGNTQALLQAVNLAYPFEAYVLYNNLISKSPYLSDDVLIKAIENEDVLPPLMLKLILIANPQAIKSDRVLDALYKRFNPFPEEWIQELKDGSMFVTPMEQLQGEVDYAAMLHQNAFNDIKTAYLYDSIVENPMDSLAALLLNENRLETDVELLIFYIRHNKLEAAQQLLDAIPSKYGDNQDELGEIAAIDRWDNLINLYNILIELKANNIVIAEIGVEALQTIWEIAEANNTSEAAYARTLMLMADPNYVYQEPIILPIIDPQTKSTKPQKPKALSKNEIAIYPNPANDFVTIAYQITDLVNGLQLIVCDALGKVVYTKELTNQSDQLLLVVKGYVKGNYVAAIFNAGKTIKSSKFVIE